MKRQLILLLSVFATVFLFISLVPAQTEMKNWEKTLTLSNGEVVAILIYDRRISMVSFLGRDETDRRSEGIYFHWR